MTDTIESACREWLEKQGIYGVLEKIAKAYKQKFTEMIYFDIVRDLASFVREQVETAEQRKNDHFDRIMLDIAREQEKDVDQAILADRQHTLDVIADDTFSGQTRAWNRGEFVAYYSRLLGLTEGKDE